MGILSQKAYGLQLENERLKYDLSHAHSVKDEQAFALESCRQSLGDANESVAVRTPEHDNLSTKCATFTEEIVRLENALSSVGRSYPQRGFEMMSIHTQESAMSDASTDRTHKFLALQLTTLQSNKEATLARFLVTLGTFSQGKALCVCQDFIHGYALALGKSESTSWFRQVFSGSESTSSLSSWHAQDLCEFGKVEVDFEKKVFPLLVEVSGSLGAGFVYQF